jgi:catechol 2,3-dioxygenase-like lactoylglutathione lyase family enzyme
MLALKINAMDHIVLNVADIDRSLEFYAGVLGLEVERLQEFREGKVGFPSLRIDAGTLIDLTPVRQAPGAEAQRRNLNHFCLVADATDLGELAAALKARGIEIVTGPVSRWGARGTATSIYVLDPDGNEVEIRCY